MVSIVLQELGDLLDIHGIVKGRGITNLPFISRHLDDEGREGGEEERGREGREGREGGEEGRGREGRGRGGEGERRGGGGREGGEEGRGRGGEGEGGKGERRGGGEEGRGMGSCSRKISNH